MESCPLCEEIKTPKSPLDCYRTLSNLPYSFFLDSSACGTELGGYSYIGGDPFLTVTSYGNKVFLTYDDGRKEELCANPFDVIKGLLKEYKICCSNSPVPFACGGAGYFGYELGRHLESLPQTAQDDLGIPEMHISFYDFCVAFDHVNCKTYILSTGFPFKEGANRENKALLRINALKEVLKKPLPPLPPNPTRTAKINSNFTKEQYLNAVEKTRQYIKRGDIFQANISQRFDAELSISPLEFYQSLREINPSRFGAFLNCGDFNVISSSPELFLRLRGSDVQTCPIKGTRPRGKTSEQDEQMKEELLASRKDMAENVMIVDLERNDLGRVCEYGSVEVKGLAELEVLPKVFHLTSTVKGKLKEGLGAIDLLKATFPGGSITGAPKVRAMEIIDEIEPCRRGVYTGSIGCTSFDGNMDLNIAIRTAVAKNGRVYYSAGGGITWGSDAQEEYQETLDKAQAFFQTLNGEFKAAGKKA